MERLRMDGCLRMVEVNVKRNSCVWDGCKKLEQLRMNVIKENG
jgi:hypothetical protein